MFSLNVDNFQMQDVLQNFYEINKWNEKFQRMKKKTF